MIKIKPPFEEMNKKQEAILAKTAPAHRRYHELMYSYINAGLRYDDQFRDTPHSQQDYKEWLNSLDPTIAKIMKAHGQEKGRQEPNLIKFVKKKREAGKEEYVRGLMGPEDYEELKGLSGGVIGNGPTVDNDFK